MAKIFIGMSVYNGQKFLKNAIDCLLNQSYLDLTLFISDDASKDDTEKICREYAVRDSRVRYYRQEKNIGMFPNFRFVLDQADGDYFMWASQDDLWERDFIKVCLQNIESQKVDVAMTVMTDVDSYGRNLRELTEIAKLSGRPSIWQVAKYVLQSETLGKCNLMYSVFKTNVIKKVWEIYPQKMEWGSDYHFSLATISHFSIYIDERVLFKKRHGGFSSQEASQDDVPDKVKRIGIKNPKNQMFPFGRFGSYLKGHLEAVRGTGYGLLVTFLLFLRLPRAFIIYLSQRNYKKFFKINTIS